MLQQVQRQLVARTIPSAVCGHAGFVQTCSGLGPRFGQGQPHIHQGMARARDVPQIDRDLTMVDFAQAATPLACHAHRVGPGRGKGRRIHHHHAIGLAQVLRDLACQFLPQEGILPLGPADEALEGEAILSKAIRNGCDVFAFQIREQALDLGMSMLRRFLAAEGTDKGRHKGCQPGHHLGENLGRNVALFQQLPLASGVFHFHVDAPYKKLSMPPQICITYSHKKTYVKKRHVRQSN